MRGSKLKLLLLANTLVLVIMAGIAISFYLRASQAAKAMAQELRAVGEEYIEYTVTIRDTIPLMSDVSIVNEVPVNLNMELRHTLPIHIRQQVKDSFLLPLRLKIAELMHVDTSMILPDSLQLYAQGSIPVDQKFSLLGSHALKVRTQAEIPLHQVIKAKLLHSTSFNSDIPVRLELNQQLPVGLDLSVPIDQVIPVQMPIRSTARVSFPEKLNIIGYIPIQLQVPVRIPLSQTPLKKHLDKAAGHLEGMF